MWDYRCELPCWFISRVLPMQAIPLGCLSTRHNTLVTYPWQRYISCFSGSPWKMDGRPAINWGNPMGTGGIPQSPLPALVPSSSYGAGVSNSRGHQRPVSAVTACFGGIRHMWAKVVLLLWEVVLCRKQRELGIAAVRLTVVSRGRVRPTTSSGLWRAPGTRTRGCGAPWLLRSGSYMNE